MLRPTSAGGVALSNMADQPMMRSHRRVSVCAPITYQVGNEEGEGTAWNLSRCGCQFTGNLSLREGTFFSFTLSLSTSERVYVAAACVCWTDGTNHGVEYLVIDDESVETLAAFIDREAAAVRNRDE
ncbi:MAG: PilZ domain-containing protein (plasmid) [Nitrospira sp.]